MITPRNVHQSLKKRTVNVPVAALTAGADVADVPFFRCPCALEIVDVHIIPQGDDSGIDATNSSAWLIEYESTALVSKTFNDDPAFPDNGVAAQLTLTATAVNLKRNEGDVLTYSVTNGTTAATPATMLQLEYVVADEAFFDQVHPTVYST